MLYGQDVPDGFFLSLTQLKNPTSQAAKPSEHASLIFSTIVSLCSQGNPIPEVCYDQTLALLKALSPHVADISSITPTHYLTVGVCGVTHFQALLNLLVSNVNLATLKEINSAWAVMRHQGGSKPHHLAKSWRCISTCPLVAKAMDLYVYGLHKEQWEAVATPTQFMRDSSSHELCDLTLTEAITHSTRNLKLPIIHIYLDKESAFNSALKEHIISAAFSASNQTPSQSILYLAHHLSSRMTYLKHNTTVMGPIHDGRGVEQGGISSSKMFQLTTDNELCTLNSTGLGIPLGSMYWLPLDKLMMKSLWPILSWPHNL